MTKAILNCACGYRKEFTEENSFRSPTRSAKQAAKGHVSGTDCTFEQVDIDLEHIKGL